jgi:hypothetical protein
MVLWGGVTPILGYLRGTARYFWGKRVTPILGYLKGTAKYYRGKEVTPLMKVFRDIYETGQIDC